MTRIVLRHAAEAFPPARQETILNNHRVIGVATNTSMVLNCAKVTYLMMTTELGLPDKGGATIGAGGAVGPPIFPNGGARPRATRRKVGHIGGPMGGPKHKGQDSQLHKSRLTN